MRVFEKEDLAMGHSISRIHTQQWRHDNQTISDAFFLFGRAIQFEILGALFVVRCIGRNKS
jgi:hypothetical protein